MSSIGRVSAGGPGGAIDGRKLWIPQMSWGGAVAFAAAFRSVGVDAEVCPDSDDRTLELAARQTSGEECLPARVTLGNFLKIIEQPDFTPGRTAFCMPTADGPCRFGQYSHYLRRVLHDLGLKDVIVFAPSSRDGYRVLGTQVNALMRNVLRGLLCADLLRKMLHTVRPYEASRGDADAVHAEAIAQLALVLERRGVRARECMRALEQVLQSTRDRFRRVPAHYTKGRILIGVVGEIFCRLTPFTNEDVIRKIEQLGGECTLAHIIEWLWYTNAEHQKRLRQQGRRFSKAMLASRIASYVQRRDEHRLTRIFDEDFRGHQEPTIERVLRASEPYLPHSGALGEMTLSVGKAVIHHQQGCDGVVDISPFTCMNGIVTEGIYPRVSADCDGIPIRNFFFDGGHTDIERDLGIFMELAWSYQARKATTRVYSSRF